MNCFLTEIGDYIDNQIWEVIYTTYSGHAIQLAKEYSINGFDLILAVGGDGTFNEVINGVLLSEKLNTIVGLIPNGTGNDFCRAQALTFDKYRILNAIKNRNYTLFDLGKVNQNTKVRYFINVMDIGFGGFATHILDRQRRNFLLLF